MSSTSSVASSGTASNIENTKPLWKFVTKRDDHTRTGGNLPWTCNFCLNTYRSSYTRVRAHLLNLSGGGIRKCTKVTTTDLLEMQRLDEELKERLNNNEPKGVPLPPSTRVESSYLQGTYDSKKRKTSEKEIVKHASNIEALEQLDAEIAKMFYSGGLSFNLARNPYYQSSYSYAANNKEISGYVPPSYNKLRTTLLQKERENVNKLLAPIRLMWREKGVSVVSDGWSDSQRRPLINFMAVSDGQPMFLKAVDCSGETKDKFFIANLLKEVINEIGNENVVQVITDNASNCKGAGQLIEQQFPNIVWTPCVVHTLNLALKNICAAKNVETNQQTYEECSWITDIVGDVMQIKQFIMNHSMRLSMFNEFVTLKLFSVAETRFASMIVMLRRFKLIKCGLQTMLINEKWSLYKDDDVVKAKFVKDKVLDDTWWESIEYILAFTGPIYDMLRICDTDKPCLHLVYDMWDTMIEKVRKVVYFHEKKRNEETSIFYEVVHQILMDRWNKSNTPLHCLAHSLTPRYYSHEWLNEDSSRVPPHKDQEVCKERMRCIKKYYPNFEDRNKLQMEYANFISNNGDFNEYDAIKNRYSMDPKNWWLIYGGCAPMLQSIALKLLAQPSSSSCAERNWSTYSFVHSVKRNSMTPQRAEDLIFIHNNLRLLSRSSKKYAQGETKMWDIAGDAFDTFEDVGLLEIAKLSLDEPEMEADICRDDATN